VIPWFILYYIYFFFNFRLDKSDLTELTKYREAAAKLAAEKYLKFNKIGWVKDWLSKRFGNCSQEIKDKKKSTFTTKIRAFEVNNEVQQ